MKNLYKCLVILSLLFYQKSISQCLSVISSIGYQNIVKKSDGTIYTWGSGVSPTAQNSVFDFLQPTHVGNETD